MSNLRDSWNDVKASLKGILTLLKQNDSEGYKEAVKEVRTLGMDLLRDIEGLDDYDVKVYASGIFDDKHVVFKSVPGRIPDDYDISVIRVTGPQDTIYCGIYDADIEGSVGLEIPVSWLQNENSLRKASEKYWKQKEKQTKLLEQQKEKEAEKIRLAQEKKERELYMELKKKYGGK